MGLNKKLLLLYTLFIPIMKVPDLPLFRQKIQYSDVVFLFILGVWLVGFIKHKKRLQNTPAIFPLVAMLFIFFFSFINCDMRVKSAIEFLGIFYLSCLYFILVQEVASEKIWWKIIKCWTIISLLLSITSILVYAVALLGYPNKFLIMQFNLLGKINSHLACRVVATFRHPGMFATYLHVSIIFGFIFAFRAQKFHRKYAWIYLTIILCIIAALLTKARINAGIALTTFLIFTCMKIKSRIVSVLKYILFLSFVIIFAFVFVATIWWIFPIKLDIDTIKDTAFLEFNLTPQFYFIQNKIALRIIKDHPLIGVGMGMYNYRSSDHVKWAEVEKSYKIIAPHVNEKDENSYKKGNDPHSTYLGWASETGLLGLTGILFFIGGVIFRLHQQIIITGDSQKFFYQCLLAGLVGFLLNGLYIDILTMRHFWFFVGMAAALVQIHKTTA